MAARSRPRAGQLKEEVDEERSLWNQIRAEARRIDQLMVRFTFLPRILLCVLLSTFHCLPMYRIMTICCHDGRQHLDWFQTRDKARPTDQRLANRPHPILCIYTRCALMSRCCFPSAPGTSSRNHIGSSTMYLEHRLGLHITHPCTMP